jgi:signal transduction histidine kinase
VYLEEIVDDATRAIAHVAARRQVTVELRTMTQAPFRGDPDLLGRVFLNLLDNAIKHSPTGGAVVVEMAERAGHHDISVIDEGPGIPAELRETVFERFYRGDSSRGRTGETAGESAGDGAGLGLSIARRIVTTHGGTIVVAESRPGRTEFRVSLPRTE